MIPETQNITSTALTLNDWLMILAVLLAPVIAIQSDRLLERGRKKNENKLNVFKTLMASRGNLVSSEHVEALNMIDLEFYDVKPITDAWKAYLDQLMNMPSLKDFDNESKYNIEFNTWNKERENLLTSLLKEMANHLKYDFDRTYIKRSIYSPIGHQDLANDQYIMRKSLISLLSGEIALPIKAQDHSKKETSS